jgi:hypothetical protein
LSPIFCACLREPLHPLLQLTVESPMYVRASQPANQRMGMVLRRRSWPGKLMRIPPFHSPVLELVRPFMAILPEIAPPERKVRLSVNVKSTQ